METQLIARQTSILPLDHRGFLFLIEEFMLI